MKCLFVKAPFAGWIVDGVKVYEYRTRETYIRGRIGIIESGTGTVIGDAMLTDCRRNQELGCYEWTMRQARRYATPVPFEHKQGAITWIEIEYDPEAQQLAPNLSSYRRRVEAIAYRKASAEYFAKLKHRQGPDKPTTRTKEAAYETMS